MNEYKYHDIAVGMEESFTVTLTQEMMAGFQQMTGDSNPLHSDAAFAQEKGFPDKVAYGMLTASFLSTLAGVYLPGKFSLIHGVEAEFPKPVFVGDRLTVTGRVTEKNDLFRIFIMKVAIYNGAGQKVCRGRMRMGVQE